MTPHIILKGEHILLVIPFSTSAQQQLKRIPQGERRFTKQRWQIKRSDDNLEICKEIVRSVFKIDPAVFSEEGDVFATRSLALDTTSKYSILGLTESATQDEIRRAYRTMAMKLHPDTSEADREFFIKINSAYNTLKDPLKRKRYDVARSLTGPKVIEETLGLRLRAKDIQR